MSGDKRSVVTDALETLGTILEGGTGKRDAIHVAVEPVVAGETLRAGEHIAVEHGIAYGVGVGQGVGIVDPFLHEQKVKEGQSFWCLVYPRTIKSLRHVWSHPEFPDCADPVAVPGDKAASEQWLRDFCASNDCPEYEKLFDHIKKNEEYDENDEYLLIRGQDAHGDIPPEFWDHVEVVLGVKIKHRATYFSCSC